MTPDEIDNVRLKYLLRIRAGKAAGGFLLPVPQAVKDVITLFEKRDYIGCKKRCADLMSEGLWVALGQVAVQGCDEMLELEPPKTTTIVEVIKR
jgi:hypothetical protein